MIDTTASIFLAGNVEEGLRFEEDKKNGYYNLEELANYLDKKMSVQNNNKKLRKLSEHQVSFAAKELKKRSDIQVFTRKHY